MTATGNEMGLTDFVAHFAAQLELKSVPPEVLSVARASIIDLVGVSLAGFDEEASQGVIRFVKSEGSKEVSSVIGGGFRSSPANAAFANGTSGHALDLDDVSLPLRGHPTVTCAPAVLAVAEALGASGADTLAGYIVGAEVTIAMAYAAGRTHYLAGWHSTATLGTIGSAAAAARIMNIGVDKTRAAIAIAASMSSGLRRNFGSMTKPLHAGHAAKCGVTAAALAAQGFTADATALEAPLGFLSLYSHDANAAAAMTRLGREWSLVNPGINIKLHACCYGSHHAADATLELRSEHQLTADMVESVEVVVAPGGMAALIHDRPSTGLEGKFSIPYIVAAALTEGSLSLGTFTDERVQRAEVVSLLSRVRCREAEGKAVGVEAPRFAEVNLRLRNGTTLHRRVDHPHGSPEAPLDQAELDRKFADCAGACLNASQIERALQMFHELDRLDSVTDVMAVVGKLEE